MGAAPAADEVIHPRIQIKVPRLPKERHQSQTHMKRRTDHQNTIVGSSKAKHRTRVIGRSR